MDNENTEIMNYIFFFYVKILTWTNKTNFLSIFIHEPPFKKKENNSS